MKNILLAFLVTLITGITRAQGVAINNNAAPADPSSLLDISSHEKGILIPRLRTIERTAIAGPVQGLLAYDIDTHSFWYFDNGSWKEIFNSGNPVTPGGIAGGNLSGNYPNPTVAKIQNLNVSSNFPFDKQVMKWDAINNEWSGLNDSLFLPYNVTFSNPAVLFGITNSSLAGGGTAIYGKRTNAGSGMSLANSTGVWGDDATGAGVSGTGNTGYGVYGLSVQNHGINGWTTAPGFAGVYGNNSALNAYGVMGEVSGKGYAVYGKSTGISGKAGVFENKNILNTDTVVKISQFGTGMGTYIFSGAGAINPSMQIDNNGENYGIKLNNNNSGSFSKDALLINNSANGYAINAISVGEGGAASFTNTSSVSGSTLINAATAGNGSGLVINLSNISGFGNVIDAYTSGAGIGINAKSNKGIAAKIENDNAANTNETLNANNLGRGSVAIFTKNNTTGSISDIQLPAVLIDNTSKGDALKITSLHAPSIRDGINVNYDGLGYGINVSANYKGIHSTTSMASGISIIGENLAGGIGVKGISGSSTNAGIDGENNNASGIGVHATSSGANGTGVYAKVTGTNGTGIYTNATGTGGTGLQAENNSAIFNAIYGENFGGGTGIFGRSDGILAMSPIGVEGVADPVNGTVGIGVKGRSFGIGDGVRGYGSGSTGNGVSGFAENNSAGIGVLGQITGGTGYAIKGVSNISNRAAIFGVNSSGDGVAGTSNGNGNGISGISGPPGSTGAGVYGSTNITSTTGRAGLFEVNSASHSNEAVRINNAGLGSALYLNSSNASNNVTMVRVTMSGTGDYIIFEDGAGNNDIRFNSSGKGFFNGGTQTGGADMAEVFDVSTDIKDYEPGDVLIIAVDKDRTVVKSSAAYSNLVVGVYATKPGVLMTEENINADLSGKVPMGILGVIPTKVCIEGGEIKRGDFIVTSSISGVAMKADPERVKPGQIIGKALENFNSKATGKIKVLVNVK